jgi:2-polyprenyl-3-methyl-5-hydroxy-6-metoxy-1,4-benzoquinol methylase
MEAQAAFWDQQAASFDDEPDHGVRDLRVRAAWTALLVGLLPQDPSRIVDLGCGTGSLSVLMAQLGHELTGIDFSSSMIEIACQKARAASVEVDFRVADASDPPLAACNFDVVLARHVLWALPDPAAGLRRWIDLLTPTGRLVLIEGRWSTGAGLTASETLDLLRVQGLDARATPLNDAAYWARAIDDERYVVSSPPLAMTSK